MTESSLPKPLAFVIEDDETLASIFTEAVKAAGFEAQAIGDGQAALDYLDKFTPRLVLLDLHLPEVSGDQILNRIRNDSRLAKTRVVVASADPLRAEDCRPLCDMILLKPITFNQLRELAERLRRGMQDKSEPA